MKKVLRVLALTLCVVLMVSMLTACKGNGVKTVYKDEAYGFQTEAPKEGETIAIMHTSKGDIYIRLFPEAAPKAVENFITHASNGYYDGLTFHRVMGDFMIQGGDPNGDGTGGESIWKVPFEDEFDKKLLNLRGALSMGNSGENTNGSQFFINQMTAADFGKRESYSDENIDLMYQQVYEEYAALYGDQFKQIYGHWSAFKEANHQETYVYKWIPDEVWDVYEALGGNISLDGAWRKSGGHTVFGHVFKGMDVVDAIAAVEVDENDKPVNDVIIKSIEVTVYKSEMMNAQTLDTTATTTATTTTAGTTKATA